MAGMRGVLFTASVVFLALNILTLSTLTSNNSATAVDLAHVASMDRARSAFHTLEYYTREIYNHSAPVNVSFEGNYLVIRENVSSRDSPSTYESQMATYKQFVEQVSYNNAALDLSGMSAVSDLFFDAYGLSYGRTAPENHLYDIEVVMPLSNTCGFNVTINVPAKNITSGDWQKLNEGDELNANITVNGDYSTTISTTKRLVVEDKSSEYRARYVPAAGGLFISFFFSAEEGITTLHIEDIPERSIITTKICLTNVQDAEFSTGVRAKVFIFSASKEDLVRAW